nr:MAG TPA: Tape measure domain protein [Caudoviricetes sp.]
MGDLSFSLTLKSRIEEETKKIIRELNKVDSTGKQAQNALEAISEATKGIGDKGGQGLKKLNDFVKELHRNIGVFSSEDFFSPKKLQQLESVQDGLYKIGRILGEVSKEGAGFNIFPNSVATEANKAERELHKLSSIIDEINKRHGEGIQMFGVESTNNIRQSLSELSKYRTELEQIRNNGGIHPITGLTASDVVKSAGYLNAIDEAKTYAKVVKNAILERYKTEQDAEKKRKKDEADAAREAKANEKQRQNELKNTERRYDSLGNKVRQLRSEYSRGISIGADVSKAEAEISRLLSLMRALINIKGRLNSESWKDSLGMLGNIGSGHDTTLASRVLQDQKAVNQEVQKGIELEQKRQQEIAQSAAKARNDLAAAFAGANAEAKKMQSIVGDIKSLFLQGGIVFGAQQFFNSIVQTGGEIVQQHVALRSILGDVQKADELFAQTQQLALQSPFKFGELNRDVKQLAAFGVEANDLYDTTKRLADIASGLGVDFGRLGLAFGQVKARSWLDGKELRQFAYAGLPLLQKITELYNSEGKNGRKNYTQADVKKMISGRQVSFEDVQKVLWKMTDEGGQFYNMQLVLSETLLGRWNKFIDAWDIMLGKFAEGKNVIGGTFSFIINRVTDLVLALDKLSPAMLSFGAIFAARKLGLMASGKLGLGSINKNYTQQMNAQLRTYAIEQQQLVTEGKITQQKALQNVQARAYLLSDTASRANAMSRLALEGKMSVLQMQKAVKEGLITKELVSQLAVMGQITARQEQIILGGTRFAAVMNMGISKIGGGIKSLFTMLGGWWGLAIGAAVQIFSSYSSDMDRISENAKGFRDSAYNKKKSYEDELANEKPTNSADLQQRVNSMKELLQNSGDYTQTIEDQIARAKNLNEQYDILNKGIVAARDNSQQEANDSDVVAGALGASGGWGSGNPFADTIEDAVEDLNEAVIKYQTLLSGLDEDTKSRMDSVANQFLKPEERAMSLDEKIRILAERGGANWDSFVLKSSNGSNDIANSIYKIGIRANKVSDQINDIAKKNIPRIINFLKKSFNLFGVDFSKWCNRNSSRFASMIERMLDACKVNVPQIREYLKSIFYQEAGAKQPKKAGGGKTEKPKTPMQQRVRRNLSKKGKSRAKVEAQATMLDSYLDETSDYNTDNNLQTELQNRYNEYKNRENKFKRGKISKALRDEAWESYNSLNQAAWEGLGYKFYPQDKKSNKVPKGKNGRSGRQEDAELKRLQERLSSLKSARQMYQKYKSIMPDEEAKKKTYNLFPEVTGLNLDDYQKAVHSLLEGFSINTTERKKFQTSIYREVAEWLFDEKDKKEYERKAADFTELLNRLSSQWDLYKELFSKTGDKNFSSAAFDNPGYIDDKAKELIVEYNNKFGKDFRRENAMSMTDGVAKETLKGPGEYEAWKKIVDLLRNNYIKILQDAADIIEKTEDYDDKILKIRERYNELISKTNDPGIKARYEIQRDKEIGQVKLDKFKNSSDYLNFYGAIVSLGMDKAQAIGARIRQNINEALQNGAIDAKEYAKEIKQLDEQLSKLEKLRPSFLNGGLEGIVNAKKERANDMITLGSSQYNKAKEDLNKAKMNGDLEGMAAAASSKAAGEKMMEGGEKLLKGASKMSSTISMIDTIIHGINDIVQGANDTFQDIKSTASALGIDTESDGWTDANSFFEGFSSSSASATKAWESLKSGNVGGVVSGVVGSFTGWIKAFSAGHDAKLDRQIKLAERQLNELKNLSSNINSVIEKTLGGIYSYNRSSDTTKKLNDVKNDYKAWDVFSKTNMGKTFFGGHNFSHYSKETYDAVMKTETNPSAYADQLALLHAQEDELRKQRQAEEDKKKTDKDKLADYDQQIKEMELQIKTFAQDFLKDVYSIDMKSWASTLTDTIVSAWAKGEDAVDAYREKVKDMVRDVTKNIVSQKIMEKALEKPLEWLTGILDEKGKLDETDMNDFADKLYQVGENVVPQLTGIFDALKNKGLDLRENGSSSTTNSIKGITEETADLLASYLNAVRLDVSVIREMQGKFIPEMSEIAKSQLTQLNLIARNTLRNADAAERIEKIFIEYNDNFNRVINGTKSLKMK